MYQTRDCGTCPYSETRCNPDPSCGGPPPGAENCCNDTDDDGDGKENGYDTDCQNDVNLSSGSNSVCWWTEWNNYSNNRDYYSGWFICPSGYTVSSINITQYTEANYDYFYMYDENNTQRYKDSGKDGTKTIDFSPYNSQKVRFRFTSDGSVTEDGVKVNTITCSAPACNLNRTGDYTIDFPCILEGEHHLYNGNLTITTGGYLQMNPNSSLTFTKGYKIVLEGSGYILTGENTMIQKTTASAQQLTINVKLVYSRNSDTYARYHTVVLDCQNKRDTNAYVTSGCVSTDCDSGERCGLGTETGTKYHDFTFTGFTTDPHYICYFPSSPSGYTWNASIYTYENGAWVLKASGSNVTGRNWLCAYPVYGHP